MRHAAGALAYAVRVELGDGNVMAYSGDTGWTDALVEVSANADLFLVGGYSPTPVRWHLDLAALAAHRHRLDCRRLVLTHFSPTALAAGLTGWDVGHDGLDLNLER